MHSRTTALKLALSITKLTGSVFVCRLRTLVAVILIAPVMAHIATCCTVVSLAVMHTKPLFLFPPDGRCSVMYQTSDTYQNWAQPLDIAAGHGSRVWRSCPRQVTATYLPTSCWLLAAVCLRAITMAYVELCEV